MKAATRQLEEGLAAGLAVGRELVVVTAAAGLVVTGIEAAVATGSAAAANIHQEAQAATVNWVV